MSNNKKGLRNRVFADGRREDLGQYLKKELGSDNKITIDEAEHPQASSSELFSAKVPQKLDNAHVQEPFPLASQDQSESAKAVASKLNKSQVQEPTFVAKIPKALRADAENKDKANFKIPTAAEFKQENLAFKSEAKEPLFDMNIKSPRINPQFLDKADKPESASAFKKEPSAEIKPNLEEKTESLKEKTAHSFKSESFALEDPFTQDEISSESHAEAFLDDPDKVPVVPTLRDDEVPNLPGAILMHARELLGLSIREVAEKLQLRINTISDIEHDRLNQKTAVSFVSVYIGNYARLVNIDPQTLIDLYVQNVEDNAQKGTEIQKQRGRLLNGRKFIYSAIALVVLGAIGVAAYAFLSADSGDEHQASGTLKLSQTNPQFNAESGSLSVASASNNGTTANASAEQAAPEVYVNPNTQRAKAQALALEQSEDFGASSNQNLEDIVPASDAPLTLSGVEVDTGNQFAKQQRVDEPNFAAMKQEVNTNSQLVNKPQSETLVIDTKAEEAQAQAQAQAQAKAEALALAQKKAEDEAKKKALEEGDTKLSSKLKDISARTSLAGREGLASMNNAQISVSGNVSLKVTDSRGHVLKQGSFKSGDSFTVSGIPPLRVHVSDSAKIKIRYMGGRVKVPSAKQVSFTLPTK